MQSLNSKCLIILFSALIVMGILPSHTAANNMRDSVMRVGLDETGIELNPHVGITSISSELQDMLFETLVNADNSNAISPGLATEWTVSEDGTVFQFRIRENVSWSDGTPITAESIALYYSANINDLPAPLGGYETPPRVSLTSDNLLEVVFPVPAFNVIFTLTQPFAAPLPVHLANSEIMLQAWGTKPPQSVVYSGPYIVVSSDDDLLSLRRNEHYHSADQVRNNGADLSLKTTNVATLVSQFLNQQLDLVFMSTRLQDEVLQNLDPDQYVTIPEPSVMLVLFNTTKAPLDTPALRRALAMVSRLPDSLNETSRPLVAPQYSFVLEDFHPAFEPRLPPWQTLSEPEALQEARAIIADLGYSADNPLQIELVTAETPGPEQSLGNLLRSRWSQIFVQVEIISLDFDKVIDRMIAGDFSTVLVAWEYDSALVGEHATPFSAYETFESSSDYNVTNFSNPKYDNIISRWSQTEDMVRLNDLSMDAQDLLFEYLPGFPIVTQSILTLKQPGLTLPTEKDVFILPALPLIGFETDLR